MLTACLKGADNIFNEFLSKDEELEAAAKNLLYRINHELEFDRQVWLIDSEYEELLSAY